MILAPHILVGALLIQLFPYSPWVFLIILLSHYLLDMVPHWEYLDMSLSLKKARYKILLDLFIGLGLVLVSIGFSWQILLGIFFAMLPDLPIALFSLFKNNKFLKIYFDFNNKTHWFYPSPVWLGILTQVIVVLIVLISFNVIASD